MKFFCDDYKDAVQRELQMKEGRAVTKEEVYDILRGRWWKEGGGDVRESYRQKALLQKALLQAEDRSGESSTASNDSIVNWNVVFKQ